MHDTVQRLSTPEILRRLAVSRDPEAWGLLLEAHGPWLLGIARRFTRDANFAEDIVQEVLLHIRDHAGRFQGATDADARAWMARVACNLALSLLRSGQRQQRRDRMPSRGTSTMDSTEHYEWAEVLQREIVSLPESLRRPVVLRYFAELSLGEIATELRLTESAVKNRVTRGVERLRRQVVLAGIPVSAAMIERVLSSTATAAPHAAENIAQWQALLHSPKSALPLQAATPFKATHAAALFACAALLIGVLFFNSAAALVAKRPSDPDPDPKVPAAKVAPQAAATPPILETKEARVDLEKVHRLLENLNSADAKLRDESEAALAAMGLAARPFVKSANDKAVSSTLARILRKIDADQDYIHMAEQRAHHGEFALTHGGSAQTEQAVADALAWLAAHQEADGHWSPGADADKQSKYSVGATSFALLALLGAGNSEDTGPYAEQVHRGVKWLIDHQSPSGGYLTPQMGCYGYEQPMAATAIAEAALLSHHAVTLDSARRALNQAINDQSSSGAWYYTPRTGSEPRSSGDLSITSWYAQFLYLTRGSELNAGDAVLEHAQDYLASCQSMDHGFNYTLSGQDPSDSCTAMGAYSLQLLRGTNESSTLGVEWLAQHLPPPEAGPLDPIDARFGIYVSLFKTNCLHYNGGPAWERWNAALKDSLLKLQSHEGESKGSFSNGKIQYLGTAGMTAMAALIFESYYRIPN